MIDPVNSLVSAISDLKGASGMGERAGGDQGFLELLQAIGGLPLNPGGLPGSASQAALTGAGQQILPDVNPLTDLPSTSPKEGERVNLGAMLPAEKRSRSDESAALEMIIALLMSPKEGERVNPGEVLSAKKRSRSDESAALEMIIALLMSPKEGERVNPGEVLSAEKRSRSDESAALEMIIALLMSPKEGERVNLGAMLPAEKRSRSDESAVLEMIIALLMSPKEGERVNPGAVLSAEKWIRSDEPAALGMVMTLLSAAALHLQPWPVKSADESSVDKSGGTTNGGSQGVKMGGLTEQLLALAPGENWPILEQAPARQDLRLDDGAKLPLPEGMTSLRETSGELSLPQAPLTSQQKVEGENPIKIAASGDVATAEPVDVRVKDGKVAANLVIPAEGELVDNGKTESGTQQDLKIAPVSTQANEAKSVTPGSQTKIEAPVGHAAPFEVQVVEANHQDATQISQPALAQVQRSRPSREGSLADSREQADPAAGDQIAPTNLPGSEAISLIQAPENPTGLSGPVGPPTRARITTSQQLSASIADQIARRANLMLGRGRAALSLQLDPPELGKVRVHVSFSSDGLQVRLAAEANGTRDIIQASLPQLRTAFESQGLTVDRFDLAAGPGFSGFHSSADGAPRQGLSSSQATTSYPWSEDAEVEASESPAARTQNSLVDYRI
ncbi:MAG: flagellar hook-length control protein FliK [Chloroflexi bacterium]|nr:flagellar hook-length control protein FliK [Chloroflexota bacterium]